MVVQVRYNLFDDVVSIGSQLACISCTGVSERSVVFFNIFMIAEVLEASFIFNLLFVTFTASSLLS